MSKVSKIQVGVMLSLGYFRSAQLSVNFLLSQKNIGKIFVPKSIKKAYRDYIPPFDLENGSIFLAARFNFKHALELSIKSLFLTAEKTVPEGHNLEILCDKMKKELLNVSILQKSFDAWEWMIKEYFTNDKYAPKDAYNELDRYMFAINGKQFPYKAIHSITRKDLKIFLRDIKTAKRLFWRMNAEHDSIKGCKKINLDPNKKIKSKTIICRLINGRYITKRKAGVFKSAMLDN
jgi:HEPN domain-containing protein